MPSNNNLTSTPWKIEEDVFVCLGREAPLHTPSRVGGFPVFAGRLNHFLKKNGFTHERTPAEMRKRYSFKKLKSPNIHEIDMPEDTHSRYKEVQDWISDPDNARMLAIITAAIVAQIA
ncbi:hypothetical protein E2P81_ATG02357 [Venturia nashicola]|uniref:Uncharacterized protein n=1 Tax=Venturia nashicola TaxID=86259 RepID=A0A4Z1PN33_9PEZI|nr:hypothetical protein E6O75_ATG02417 [Venturia nashicola]TLD36575.1 hypothetical protein E2P81_ATG02357 [Venturia nashicola]